MPSLADALQDWYAEHGDAIGPLTPITTVGGLVAALGGGTAGKHAAARGLEVSARSIERYVHRERHGPTKDNRAMSPAVEARFNRAVAARDRPISAALRDFDLLISDKLRHYGAASTDAGRHITPAELAPVMEALAAGDPATAAATFGPLFLRAYGIPRGGVRASELLDVGAVTIARA